LGIPFDPALAGMMHEIISLMTIFLEGYD